MTVHVSPPAHAVLEAIARLEERGERVTVAAVGREAFTSRSNAHRHMLKLRRVGLLEVAPTSPPPVHGSSLGYRIRRPEVHDVRGDAAARLAAVAIMAHPCPLPDPCLTCVTAAEQTLRRLELAGLEVVRSERDHRVMPGQQALRLVR